ncbi:FAD-dependent oxidoreductase [Streptomyces sp. CFMR 7]|uniref:FAD-dependent oxidoreductase n=1 Tax=Streptomyces sp. CFMR 7 TaxID=1649184 RepID=UPI0006AD4679|nr:FAD-dependent oxidoreductase [Streptomyces sp. CFMR 7]ALC31178.1 FAD-dependent oxidoreductase [Streptomyces sp. CFMR 7]
MALDVLVVGGGLMGASAAWRLSARGHRVTVLERFGPGHDRGSSHGTSRIFRLAYAEPSYTELALRALPLWRRLEEESGRPVLTLTGAVDHGPPEVLERLADVLAGAGRPGRRLSPGEVAERWPGLRADTAALYHPDAGRVHADDAVAALLDAAGRRGAEVRHGVRVTEIRRTGGGATVVTDTDEALVADAVVVAVGGWAPGPAADVVSGVPPLRVTQEQPVHFPVPDALEWPSFIHHPGAGLRLPGGVYGLGSVDGVKIGLHGAGPVVDPDHRDRTPDPAALDRLRAYAEEWLPGVAGTGPEPLTCLYTTTPDEDFVIDRQGPVTVLTGCSGHAFKFGPALGELAADLVEGGPGLPRFALGRTAPGR